eukprot:210123-Amphidinium_carterae.1
MGKNRCPPTQNENNVEAKLRVPTLTFKAFVTCAQKEGSCMQDGTGLLPRFLGEVCGACAVPTRLHVSRVCTG